MRAVRCGAAQHRATQRGAERNMPQYAAACLNKLEFHDTDTDILASVSWNASYTPHHAACVNIILQLARQRAVPCGEARHRAAPQRIRCEQPLRLCVFGSLDMMCTVLEPVGVERRNAR